MNVWDLKMVHIMKDKLMKIIVLMVLVHFIILNIKFAMQVFGRIIVLMDLVNCIISKFIPNQYKIIKIYK
jgi:hypothetical protein